MLAVFSIGVKPWGRGNQAVSACSQILASHSLAHPQLNWGSSVDLLVYELQTGWGLKRILTPGSCPS